MDSQVKTNVNELNLEASSKIEFKSSKSQNSDLNAQSCYKEIIMPKIEHILLFFNSHAEKYIYQCMKFDECSFPFDFQRIDNSIKLS